MATEVVEAKVEVKPEVVDGYVPTLKEGIVREIHKVFGKNASGFIYVLTTCKENTRLDPYNVATNRNGSKDVGVGRINTVDGVRFSNGEKYTIEQLKDYRTNIKVSHEIFVRQGWKAWYGCRDHNNGVYPEVF